MNEQTTISTELAIPQATSLSVMFKTENGITPLLDELEAKVRAEANGLTVDTKKGRDALVSLAFKVSKSKAELDRQGKALTEQQRAEVKAVNDSRKAASDRLDALRDEIRAPVTKWEQMEETRVQKLKDRLAAIDADRVEPTYATDIIQGVYDEIAALEIGADWAEYREIAEAKKAAAVSKLAAYLAAAKERESQAAELEKLRAEAAARAEADRIRAELQAQRDAAEKAKAEAEKAAAEKVEQDRIAAERAEANRIAAEKAEAERAAQIERDKLAAAEAAKVEAEQRAAKEKADAEARHLKELADAKAREEAAAQRERDRIAAEAKAEAEARAKREADQAHRAKIKASIAAALSSMAGAETPEIIAEALIEGRIPHCKVSM
jgi:colicin import membrane protein